MAGFSGAGAPPEPPVVEQAGKVSPPAAAAAKPRNCRREGVVRKSFEVTVPLAINHRKSGACRASEAERKEHASRCGIRRVARSAQRSRALASRNYRGGGKSREMRPGRIARVSLSGSDRGTPPTSGTCHSASQLHPSWHFAAASGETGAALSLLPPTASPATRDTIVTDCSLVVAVGSATRRPTKQSIRKASSVRPIASLIRRVRVGQCSIGTADRH